MLRSVWPACRLGGEMTFLSVILVRIPHPRHRGCRTRIQTTASSSRTLPVRLSTMVRESLALGGQQCLGLAWLREVVSWCGAPVELIGSRILNRRHAARNHRFGCVCALCHTRLPSVDRERRRLATQPPRLDVNQPLITQKPQVHVHGSAIAVLKFVLEFLLRARLLHKQSHHGRESCR